MRKCYDLVKFYNFTTPSKIYVYSTCIKYYCFYIQIQAHGPWNPMSQQ